MWPDWLGQDGGWGFEGQLEQWVRVASMLLGDGHQKAELTIVLLMMGILVPETC
jgi:hypothetical protein